jgi:hypothetical protein
MERSSVVVMGTMRKRPGSPRVRALGPSLLINAPPSTEMSISIQEPRFSESTAARHETLPQRQGKDRFGSLERESPAQGGAFGSG